AVQPGANPRCGGGSAGSTQGSVGIALPPCGGEPTHRAAMSGERGLPEPHDSDSHPPRLVLRTSPLSPVKGERESSIPQQPLVIIQLFLRTVRLAEALAQFLKHAARALGLDLARHADIRARIVTARAR